MKNIHLTEEGSALIEVSHLTKRYGDHIAVSDLSFTVEKGQIYGFLGPNGAGKTTTMNIMTGCLAATSGEVKIGGYDIFEEAGQAKRLIGYLPEQPPLYPDRTPREYLTFVARAKGVPARDLPEQIGRVMAVTQITDMADRLIRNLSKGYKQRVGIAQALLGDPEVIILDEPTVGLDPRQIIEIRELIQELGKTHTVILSSHILSEVRAVCQTILILSNGKLVACDTPENLETLFAGHATLRLTADGDTEKLQSILSGVRDIRIGHIEPRGDGTVSARLECGASDPQAACREIFFAFAKAGSALLELSAEKASLEDVFIELTAGEPSKATEQEAKPA